MRKKWIWAGIGAAVLLVAALFWYLCLPNVPVLLYHSIREEADAENASLFVRPEDLERQLVLIQEMGYTSIFAAELPRAGAYRKPLVLTFDDGYEDNYTAAFPLLQRYNMKATIFVVSGLVDTPGYLTSEELREMAGSGLVSIQSHTDSHADLTGCTEAQVDRELRESAKKLSDLTGQPVTLLAYPYGSYNDQVIAHAKEGYRLGFTTLGNHSYRPWRAFAIPRAAVYRDTTLQEVRSILESRSQSTLGRWLHPAG